MPYTTPHTIVAGELVTVGTINNEWGGNISYLANPPTVKVRNSAAFSHTSSGGWLPITWNQEDFKSATGLHSSATNTSRLVATDAGKYRLWANLIWDGNATGLRAVDVMLNGITQLNYDHKMASTIFAGVQVTALYIETALAANDYVEFRGFQDSGGTRTIGTGSRAGMSWYSL